LAGSPILRSPSFKKATIEGVVLRPSLFAITTASLPSITATQELVVPKSIPIILLIIMVLKIVIGNNLSMTVPSRQMAVLVPTLAVKPEKKGV
jgi:hypothetical protein